MELPDKKEWLLVIIIPIAIALVLYFVVFPIMNNVKSTIVEQNFYGTWISNSKNVTITFYENKTCLVNNNGITYFGPWKILPNIGNAYLVEMNWEGFKAEYIPLFKNDNTLTLAGLSDGSGIVELTKI